MPALRLPQVVEREPAADGAAGRYLLYADVVYNGLGTPRADAAVALFSEPDESGGRSTSIVEYVDQASAVARHPASSVMNVGLAISPELVNAHTHLDLSDMPYTPGGYVDFIEAVIAHGRSGARGLPAAKRGIASVLAAGTGVVGDIVKSPEVMDHLLGQRELRGVAYWEVLGPDPETADEVFEATRAVVNGFRERERPGGMRVGLSPHTPHTVSARLLQLLAAWAKSERLPLAIHVSESPEETRLHLSGDGPIADSFRTFGVPFVPSGLSPVAYLDGLGVLAASPTLIHMVAVDEDDVRAVQRHGCVVVHCPRSNRALECGRFPWELYAKHGVDVAFGTDSAGSSPGLDLSHEVDAAAVLHGQKANPRGLVRAAVKGGHKALGLEPPIVRRGEDAAALVAWGAALAPA